MKLLVVMPAYNERSTLRTMIERVLAVPMFSSQEVTSADGLLREASR
jgi:hypothetical protein